MALSIADQIALDDALVAPADRLKIGKCNLRLSYEITSKEATLQEFWASAYVHNRSVRFKMNNKKHIIGLEQFRDILQICPKVGNKKFVDPPLESEIIIFLASLGHTGDIRKLSDEQFLPKTKGSKKKANTDAIPKPKSSTAQKLESSKEAVKNLIALMLVVLEHMRKWCYTRGFDAPDYDSDDDISWKSSDDDQDDEQDQDDDDAEKHDAQPPRQRRQNLTRRNLLLKIYIYI
ncbi:hypothetical protein Tco_0480704 [Tanacetum coccineum]